MKPEGKHDSFGVDSQVSSASGLPLTGNKDAEATFTVVLALILSFPLDSQNIVSSVLLAFAFLSFLFWMFYTFPGAHFTFMANHCGCI